MALKHLEQKIKDNPYESEFPSKLIENIFTFYDILKVCQNSWDRGCGSYLFDGQKYEYDVQMYNKQKLLYEKFKHAKNVLEIGTYMGHSLFIMLLANPELEATCIDISSKYAEPSINLLKDRFPKSKIEFINKDSITALSSLKKEFDIFHLDSAHDDEQVLKEFNLCKNLAKSNIIKIFIDDIDAVHGAEKSILDNYRILEHVKPNCSWRNCYFEIDLIR